MPSPVLIPSRPIHMDTAMDTDADMDTDTDSGNGNEKNEHGIVVILDDLPASSDPHRKHPEPSERAVNGSRTSTDTKLNPNPSQPASPASTLTYLSQPQPPYHQLITLIESDSDSGTEAGIGSGSAATAAAETDSVSVSCILSMLESAIRLLRLLTSTVAGFESNSLSKSLVPKLNLLLETLCIPVAATPNLAALLPSLHSNLVVSLSFLSSYSDSSRWSDPSFLSSLMQKQADIQRQLLQLNRVIGIQQHQLSLALLLDLPAQHLETETETPQTDGNSRTIDESRVENAIKSGKEKENQPSHARYHLLQLRLPATPYDHYHFSSCSHFRDLRRSSDELPVLSAFARLDPAKPRFLFLTGPHGIGLSTFAHSIRHRLVDESFFHATYQFQSNTIQHSHDHDIQLRVDAETVKKSLLPTRLLHPTFAQLQSPVLRPLPPSRFISQLYETEIWDKKGVILLSDLLADDQLELLPSLIPSENEGKAVLIVTSQQELRVPYQNAVHWRINELKLEVAKNFLRRVLTSSSDGTDHEENRKDGDSDHGYNWNSCNYVCGCDSDYECQCRQSQAELPSHTIESIARVAQGNLTALSILVRLIKRNPVAVHSSSVLASISSPSPALVSLSSSLPHIPVPILYSYLSLTEEERLILLPLSLLAGEFSKTIVYSLLAEKQKSDIDAAVTAFVSLGLITQVPVPPLSLYTESIPRNNSSSTPNCALRPDSFLTMSPHVCSTHSYCLYHLPSLVLSLCRFCLPLSVEDAIRRVYQWRLMACLSEKITKWEDDWAQISRQPSASFFCSAASQAQDQPWNTQVNHTSRLRRPNSTNNTKRTSISNSNNIGGKSGWRLASLMKRYERGNYVSFSSPLSLMATSRRTIRWLTEEKEELKKQNERMTSAVPIDWDTEFKQEKQEKVKGIQLPDTCTASSTATFTATDTAFVDRGEAERDSYARPIHGDSCESPELELGCETEAVRSAPCDKVLCRLELLSLSQQQSAIFRDYDRHAALLHSCYCYSLTASKSNGHAISLLSPHSLDSYRLSSALAIRLYYRALELIRPRHSPFWLSCLIELAKAYTANQQFNKARSCWKEFTKQMKSSTGTSHGHSHSHGRTLSQDKSNSQTALDADADADSEPDGAAELGQVVALLGLAIVDLTERHAIQGQIHSEQRQQQHQQHPSPSPDLLSRTEILLSAAMQLHDQALTRLVQTQQRQHQRQQQQEQPQRQQQQQEPQKLQQQQQQKTDLSEVSNLPSFPSLGSLYLYTLTRLAALQLLQADAESLARSQLLLSEAKPLLFSQSFSSVSPGLSPRSCGVSLTCLYVASLADYMCGRLEQARQGWRRLRECCVRGLMENQSRWSHEMKHRTQKILASISLGSLISAAPLIPMPLSFGDSPDSSFFQLDAVASCLDSIHTEPSLCLYSLLQSCLAQLGRFHSDAGHYYQAYLYQQATDRMQEWHCGGAFSDPAIHLPVHDMLGFKPISIIHQRAKDLDVQKRRVT